MGQPKVLENMLEAASENKSLKTWSIFQEKDGCINFKLKFDSETDSVNHDQFCYKKEVTETGAAWQTEK